MRIILLAAFLAAIQTAAAQGGAIPADTRFNSRMIPNVSTPSSSDRATDLQSKFLKEEWSLAIVNFSDGYQSMQVPILFDMYENMLYFKQGEQIMEFVHPVSFFTVTDIKKEDTIQYVFRSGFPAINANDATTFYQVLVAGKVSLLKCKAKTIYLDKQQSLPEERRSYDKEQYFAFYPDNKIVVLRKDGKEIMTAMPEYAAQIEQYLKENRGKLKSEENLRKLFIYLNSQQ